jgi:4-amino-4-deoxy-L-arabinose transferase-like glycosyltransferase
MSEYPNLPLWREFVVNQYSGLLTWCLFVVGLLFLFLLYRRQLQQQQRQLTLAVAGFFTLSVHIPLIGAALDITFPLYIALRIVIDRVFRSNRLIPVLVFALLIRLPGLFSEPFWADETVTAAFAQIPLNSIVALGGDTHPPLFYLPFWLMARIFGTSEIALRLPSLVFGVVTVYLVYRLTLALGMKEQTALVAALIIAILPGAVRYSNEARAYAQLAALVLGMTIAVAENRPRLFAGLAAATILTHNMGYVYFACLGGVGFLWYVHQTTILSLLPIEGAHNYWSPGPFKFYLQLRDLRWWYALALPAAVGLAWLPFAARQFQSISSGWWSVFTPGSIVGPLFSMTIGNRVSEPLLLQSLAAVVAITLLGLLAVRKWLLTTKGNLWVALAFGTPTVAALVSLFTPVYVDRAFLPAMLAVPVLWAYVLTERPDFEQFAAGAVLVPVLLLALLSYWSPDRNAREDWRALLPVGCDGAPVVFNTSLSTYMLARYYLPGARVIAWAGANDINLFLPQEVKAAMGIEQAEAPPPGEVCILDFDTLLSRADERAYLWNMVGDYRVETEHQLTSTSWSNLSAYVVRVP